MTRYKSILSAACSASVLYLGCAQNATIYHSFLWGMYSVAKGAAVDVSGFLDATLLDDTVSVSLTKSYIVFAYQAKQYAYVAQKRLFMEQHCTDDTELLLMLARSLDHLNKVQEADRWYARLERDNPDNAEVMYHVIRAHIRGHRLQEALTRAQKFVASHATEQASAVFYYIQAQIYQLLNKHDEALVALRACIALSPHFEQGWFLWALLHEKMQNILEAQKGYTRFLDKVGNDAAIEKKVLSLLLQEKHHNDISWYDRAVHAFHAGEMSKSLLLLSLAEKNHARCDACNILKMQIFDTLQRINDLCNTCKEVLTYNVHNEQWLRIVHTLFLHTVYKQELLTVFDEVIRKKSSQQLLLYALDCALRVNDYPKVVAYYKKLSLKKADVFLKARVLYYVGAAAYENRDISLVRTIAQIVYAHRYAYAPLLNFAAYYYSKYETAYDKAQLLLDAALMLDPQNPHFKDTQAYIYLRKGDKKRAARVLQALVYEAPLDKKIRQHRKKARYL